MTESTTSPEKPRVFPVTQWTLVLAAGATPSPESAAALERLCASYWYPLYAYLRRCGHSPCDAEDLTQEFFTRLLEHHWIARADRDRGRFRSFLLTAMKRFLANQWAKGQTLKRGGGTRLVPLQLDTAETRYSREPADTSTPEHVFERQWALTLLEYVLNLPERFQKPLPVLVILENLLAPIPAIHHIAACRVALGTYWVSICKALLGSEGRVSRNMPASFGSSTEAREKKSLPNEASPRRGPISASWRRGGGVCLRAGVWSD